MYSITWNKYPPRWSLNCLTFVNRVSTCWFNSLFVHFEAVSWVIAPDVNIRRSTDRFLEIWRLLQITVWLGFVSFFLFFVSFCFPWFGWEKWLNIPPVILFKLLFFSFKRWLIVLFACKCCRNATIDVEKRAHKLIYNYFTIYMHYMHIHILYNINFIV